MPSPSTSTVTYTMPPPKPSALPLSVSPDTPSPSEDASSGEAAGCYSVYDGVGAPHLSGISEAVSEIVSEELSAMSAGVSSPEDCAKKIQSRVSIWLAEHQ